MKREKYCYNVKMLQSIIDMFQSYVVIGNPDAVRQKTGKLAKELGINLEKVSPDIFIISPEKTSVTIGQVRNLKRHIFQKPVQYKFKFVIIEEASSLTDEAQNALLKILEEPPSHAILVLEAKNQHSLLPTILSRVIVIHPDLGVQPISGLSQQAILGIEPLSSALEKMPEITNPEEFLDSQMLALTELLTAKIKGKKSELTISQMIEGIQKCAQAKQMIAANVNPRFALADLFFSIHLSTI